MAYGFKAFDPDGNIICDGSSEMLRLHAKGSVTVSNSTASFYYSALSKPPVIHVQPDNFSVVYSVQYIKDANGNYIGVAFFSNVSTTAYILVLKR